MNIGLMEIFLKDVSRDSGAVDGDTAEEDKDDSDEDSDDDVQVVIGDIKAHTE